MGGGDVGVGVGVTFGSLGFGLPRELPTVGTPRLLLHGALSGTSVPKMCNSG